MVLFELLFFRGHFGNKYGRKGWRSRMSVKLCILTKFYDS